MQATLPEPTTGRSALRGYLAIALVSAAVLLYEIAITRVLSVVLWYHFAFLSVSLAMLGLGAPGVWFALRPPRPHALRRAMLLAGLTVPGSIVAIFKIGQYLPIVGEMFPSLSSLLQSTLVLALGSAAVPMLCLGSAVCILLLEAPGRSIGRMYGADLLGATVGALLIVPLMHRVPTPLIIAGAGLLPLVGAVVRFRPAPRSCLLAAVVVGVAMLWGEPFRLHYAKMYREPPDLLYEKWTPTARLTIFPKIWFQDEADAGFVWGMGTNYVFDEPVEQLWLEQDGSAGTPITRVENGLDDLEFLFYDVTSVGYQVFTPERVCIVGTGGGRDILTALRAGATNVDAVELNPHIIAALSTQFREFAGDVYHRPGVRAVASEGRSFLTRSPGEYDMVQISLIDSWAATAAGAYALSENYLYTEEALRLYWRRLAPGGMISITRWMRGARQLESVRLGLMALDALAREGVNSPRSHLAVVQGSAMATLLLWKEPFAGGRLERLQDVCAKRGFTLHWPSEAGGPMASLITRVLRDGPEPLEADGFELSPPTDDHPFFFQMVPIFGRGDWMPSDQISTNDHAVVLLRMLLIIMSIVTLGLFFLPFAVGARLRSHPGFWRGSGYFAAIGLAFMFVETPWIQRFILYLGHPSYATTVVLATMLLGAGLGSVAAARTPVSTVRRFGLLLPVGIVLVSLALQPVFTATLGWPFAARVGVSLLLIAPMGFLMGFPFPTGMVGFGDPNKAWFWAMNGAASVLASVSSLALSMAFGFTRVGLIGMGLYVIAWLLLPREAATRGGTATHP